MLRELDGLHGVAVYDACWPVSCTMCGGVVTSLISISIVASVNPVLQYQDVAAACIVWVNWG